MCGCVRGRRAERQGQDGTETAKGRANEREERTGLRGRRVTHVQRIGSFCELRPVEVTHTDYGGEAPVDRLSQKMRYT